MRAPGARQRALLGARHGALCATLAVLAAGAPAETADDRQCDEQDAVDAPSLLSRGRSRVRVSPELIEQEQPQAPEMVVRHAFAQAAGRGPELPGEQDQHGPNALGTSSNMQVDPILKWLLVGIVIGVVAYPIALFVYFTFDPGEADNSAQVKREHGGAVPLAVQRTADVVYRIGRVSFRLAMFVVYFWFGILKCLGVSPAEPLVQVVFRELPFMHISSADFFCKWVVGGGECLIALGFLASLLPLPTVRFWGTVCSLTVGVGHVTMVSLLPMVLLPHEVWQEGRFPYALTFEGQYIMKNLVLVSGVMVMANDLERPDDRKLVLTG